MSAFGAAACRSRGWCILGGNESSRSKKESDEIAHLGFREIPLEETKACKLEGYMHQIVYGSSIKF